MPIRRRFVFTMLAALGVCPAAAQQKPGGESGQAQPEQRQISIVTITLLIKGAVLALHQANVTGNYSVLRDLGTPLFRERFDQAALTATFSNLRARKIDLSPAMLISPNLSKNPEMNQQGELILTGDFPTQPLQIHFDLAFLQLDGLWRLAGIGVDALPAPGPQASALAPPAGPQTAAQPAPAMRPEGAKEEKKAKKPGN